MYHIFLIHSNVNGHLGCFHILASVLKVYFQYCFFYFPTVQQGGQVILTGIHYNYISDKFLNSEFVLHFRKLIECI